jgi:hypothetical protein
VSRIECVNFVGCVACDFFDYDDDGVAEHCGIPVYGVTIPVRQDNFAEIEAAAERVKNWKKRKGGR